MYHTQCNSYPMGTPFPPLRGGKGVRAILRGEGGQELVKGVNLKGKRQNAIEGGKGVENPKNTLREQHLAPRTT